MLSILSCAPWPSVCPPWRDVYLGLPPIFWLGCLLFWYWAPWAVCIFWRLILCCFICKYFLPFWGLSFRLVYGFLCCGKAFKWYHFLVLKWVPLIFLVLQDVWWWILSIFECLLKNFSFGLHFWKIFSQGTEFYFSSIILKMLLYCLVVCIVSDDKWKI